MANPNPDQSNLTWHKIQQKKYNAERRKEKEKERYAAKKQHAKVFTEDLDEQLELKAYDLHLHPNDKDKARNMGIFMRYKLLRDRGTSGGFMDMEY